MRIYLAGVEQTDANGCLAQGLLTNVFMSYYYLKEKPITRASDVRAQTKHIIIDSGAHSFFSETDSARMSASVVRKKHKGKQTPEEYFENYLVWLKNAYPFYDYFVELDIGELVGQAKVLEWRERLRVEGLLDRCITVYHPKVMTFQEYLKLIDDSASRYVAVEGDRRSRKRLPYLEMISAAYKRKCKVHGFALVKQDILNQFPFYSVDSSSWKAGARFGALIGMHATGFKSISLKGKSSKLFALTTKVRHIENAFHDNKQFQRDKRYEVSIKTYKKMEDYYTLYWKKRGIGWDVNQGG